MPLGSSSTFAETCEVDHHINLLDSMYMTQKRLCSYDSIHLTKNGGFIFKRNLKSPFFETDSSCSYGNAFYKH